MTKRKSNPTTSQLPSMPSDAAMVLARLRFNFLKLSPSYAAGCQQIALGTGRPKVNAKGREVLKTISRYGDVSKVKFNEWEIGRAHV